MSQSPFCPTRVPAGTIQDMAKRLSKHPHMAGVPLSKCQEILARTFGHASFHALKTREPSCRAIEAIEHSETRMLFYAFLKNTVDAGLSEYTGLELIEDVAAKGGQWPLRDLATHCKTRMDQDEPFGQAFAHLAGDRLPTEVFLLTTVGATSDALDECCRMAERECDEIDYARLRGS